MALSNSQIDKLGDRLRRDGPADDADRLAYDEYRASFIDALAEVRRQVRPAFELSEDWPSRLKTLESVRAKLRRSTIKLSQIHDIAGIRILVPSVKDQERALNFIQAELTSARVDDKRSRPILGYRAVHIVARTQAGRVEIQLRTAIQNAWANTSEDLSRFVGIGVKYGEGPEWAQLGLLHLSSVLAALETDIAPFIGEMTEVIKKHLADLFEGQPAESWTTSERTKLVRAMRLEFASSARFQGVRDDMLLEERIVNELWRQAGLS